MFYPFDDAKVRRNSETTMDKCTKNAKNSLILDGNQVTVCVHSAAFGVFIALYLLFKPWVFLGLPIDGAFAITEVFTEVDIEDERAVGGDSSL